MSLFKFANFISTELEEGISAGALEIEVPLAVAEALPTLAEDEEIRLTLWDGNAAPEIVSVTSNPQTGILTVTRGQENTVARAWSAGTQVICVLTAEIINTALAAYFDINTVLDANFLKLEGGTLTGPLVLHGAPTAAQHAVPKVYADAIGAGRLPTSGGTMLGNIVMGGNEVISLPAPSVASSATRKSYVDALIASVQSQLAAGFAVYTTSGTDDAYLVDTVDGDLTDLDLVDGMAFIIRPHLANDDNATIQIDDMTPKQLQITAGDPLVEDILVADTPYTIVYSLAEDAWVINGTVNLGLLQDQIDDLFDSLNAAAGTGLLAAQASAPIGWTQDTSINDRVIRIVSTAGGGTGGSWTISGISVDNHTLNISRMPNHDHDYERTFFTSLPAGSGAGGNPANVGTGNSSGVDTTNTGGSDPHNHNLSIGSAWRPAYYNVIRITKD